MSTLNIGDIVIFRKGHKNEGQTGTIESETMTGSFNIRMPNGTVCGAYPEYIYKTEEEDEGEGEQEVNNNPQPMNDFQTEVQEILKNKGFRITIAIIIVLVTVLYFRGPNTSINLEQSPIDQKVQEISRKELSKGEEYKIQKDSRERQRTEKKIEQDSITRVKTTDTDIEKLQKEVMELIK